MAITIKVVVITIIVIGIIDNESRASPPFQIKKMLGYGEALHMLYLHTHKRRGNMIPQDKNFEQDFPAVLRDLDDVLKKHSTVNSATFSVAISTFLTRHLISTAPNDYVIVSILLEPYFATRKKQIDDAKKKKGS